MHNYMIEYHDSMKSGDIIVCKKIRKQFDTLINRYHNLPDGIIFDIDLATAPINFIETHCKHSKGKWMGKPLLLELWQKAIIQAAFGFVYEDTYLRVCTEVVIMMGRKNGKSVLASAIGQYLLVADGEPGPEVYCAATKSEQAKIVFGEAVNMRKQSPFLSSVTTKTKNMIECPENFGKMLPIASDAKTSDGFNVHGGILDEIHAWKKRDMYDVILQGTSARDQALIWIMTTGGFIREGFFDNVYDIGERTLNELIDDITKLYFFYELDDREEWIDPDMWPKANPGLGTIKKTKTLQKFVNDAIANDKFKPTVLTKDFNLQETMVGSWLDFEQLENKRTFDDDMFKDCYAIGGVDLSATTDLTCATLMMMRKDAIIKLMVTDEFDVEQMIERNEIFVIQQYFIPEKHLQKKIDEDKIPYDIWEKRGLVTLSAGSKVNYHQVTDWYLHYFQEHGVIPLWIGYDPWSADYWVEEMENHGFTMEVIRQGPQTLSQPMKDLKGDLSDHIINYNNSPPLKWCLSNLCVKTDDNGNIRPMKHSNVKLRIDGAVSLLVAYATLCNHRGEYENMI